MRKTKYQLGLPVVIFVIGLLVTACGPSVISSTNQPNTEFSPIPEPVALTPPVINQQLSESVPGPTIVVAATSRDPNLEATNPTTVKLDSGGLQLVEFFRFT